SFEKALLGNVRQARGIALDEVRPLLRPTLLLTALARGRNPSGRGQRCGDDDGEVSLGLDERAETCPFGRHAATKGGRPVDELDRLRAGQPPLVGARACRRVARAGARRAAIAAARKKGEAEGRRGCDG